jgi:hypothetical protein
VIAVVTSDACSRLIRVRRSNFKNFSIGLRGHGNETEFDNLNAAKSQSPVWQWLYGVVTERAKADRNVAQNACAHTLPGFVSPILQNAGFSNIRNVGGEGDTGPGGLIKCYRPDGPVMGML